MLTDTAISPDVTGMSYQQLLERVRYDGAYPTTERAAAAVHRVMSALGRQIGGDERGELARCLPVEAALAFTAQVPDAQPLTGWAFVKDLAARTGATPATARWEAGTVLAAVSRLAGPHITARLVDHLPEGWALLFGLPQLPRPQRHV
ncbi:DUF2267 domain-containing protein [Streptomyces sp. NPDC056387]|uniref:DUF2267 domain-containing protein n=1 Tax=Streptomyces sp. NPDC056387 TaxID=3345803 RepID=UPI0035E10B53